MKRIKAKNRRDVDRGRGFFETSSPFETFDPGGDKPKTYNGLVDKSPMRTLGGFLGGKEIMGRLDPEQYDNPRGYPGIALITTGSEKSKATSPDTHSITHHAEGEAGLSRTGKR